jgi:hypothetical protein
VTTVGQARGAALRRGAAHPLTWLGSRLLLAFALPLGYPSRGPLLGDVHRYQLWAGQLAHGHYPTHDRTWQYPPGAALVMLLPRWLSHGGLSYHGMFVTLMLAADAVTYRTVRREGERPAAVWVVGGFLLGPLLLHRFDVVPTAFAVCALAAVLRGADTRAGVHLGLGALVKVWPVVLALAVPWRRFARVVLGIAVVALVALVALAATGTLRAATDFAHQEGARGVEVEAVVGLPWLLGRWARGRHALPGQSYGAYEVHGGPVHVVTAVCTLMSVLLIAVFVHARWVRKVRLDPAAVVLVIVLGSLLLARVLSPQYLVWPLGLAALGSARGGAAARSAWLVVATCAATQLEYPLAFSPVVHARTVGVLVLVARDLLLVAATWWAVKALRPAAVRS